MEERCPICVRVGPARFDAGRELAALSALGGEVGAVTSFVGGGGGGGGGGAVEGIELEHYPEMSERVLTEIAVRATARWPLLGVTVIHRVGRLRVGEPIVFVGCASAHRAAAFSACAFLVDFLKTEAPFWKREVLSDGSQRWVAARDSDRLRAARWRGEGEEERGEDAWEARSRRGEGERGIDAESRGGEEARRGSWERGN
ncbi:MAG: molybdenum cofactor biosynthesis protein MoaE [Hydrogenophilus sp.]|nr:molybdenum cofactor biosynthesis protein MoaE [Hydrogenophilus sp.]